MAEARGRSGGTNRDTGSRREKTLPKWMRSEDRTALSNEQQSRPLLDGSRAPAPEMLRRRQPSVGKTPRNAGAQKEQAPPDRPETPPRGSMLDRPSPPKGLRKPDPMDRMFGGPADPRPEFLPDPDFAALANLVKQMAARSRSGVQMLAERSGLTPQPYWETLGRPRPHIDTNGSAPTWLRERMPEWMVPNEDGFQAKLKKWIQERMAA